ncbi:DUF3566 domain-containing protein [Pseudokineococcus sp. 1T1Z-3]|uniref:DUF3566 domain-containing protein n=1 Tax=Pseudokineococcus sp. 1T1Z-3 TaxID=3132745 RepID=UPI0030B57320
MSGSQARPQQSAPGEARSGDRSGSSGTGGSRAGGSGGPAQASRPRAEGQRPGSGQASTTQTQGGRAGADPSRGARTQGAQGEAAGASQPRPAAEAPAPQRRVRLSVSRVDPWTVLKLSFLVSVVVGIAVVVAAGTLWTVLDGVGAYDSVNRLIEQLSGTSTVDVTDYVGFTQVVSAATVLAVVDVIIITALATLGAVVYNVSASLVGGVRVTLTDD